MPQASDEILGRRVVYNPDRPGPASTFEPRKAIRSDPEVRSLPPDDALDSFAPEASSFTPVLNRVRGAAAGLPSVLGRSLAIRVRDHLNRKFVITAATVACVLSGLVIVGRIVSGSAMFSTPAASATSSAVEPASEVAGSVSSNGGDVQGRSSPARATRPAPGDRRTETGDGRRPNGNGDQSALTTPTTATAIARAAAQSPARPIETVPAPEPPTAMSSDLTIYSDEDRSVQPPTMLSPELPRPTFEGWATESNAIELIIAENGTVERVRFLTPLQRMPDMMILSRAKVWKFEPAEKDGRPVRYRLVLKWDVNP
jgi:hypothetical protein